MGRSKIGPVPRLVALTAAVAVIAAAPVAADTKSSAKPRGTADGKLVIAAEQELSCADWIASCAGASWGNWTLGIHTLPQAFSITPDGDYEPGAVLAGQPTLVEGPPMTVTYPINPAAVWSDGEPITSADFEYLWEQITTGKDIYDKTGYDQIESVDTTDPKTAVVTFSEPYAAWRDLFGGFYFLLPSHLLEGKNRFKELKDGYAFSGGPWELKGGKKGWKKGKSITLVPNDAYWGEKPRIAEVTFQFITETSAEAQAVLTGQASAAYPQPQIGILDQFDENPDLTYEVNSGDAGNTYEGLWLNAKKFPLDSLNVRKALIYATDRQAIIDNLLIPSVREGEVLQSFVVPLFDQFTIPAFEQYTHDLQMVDTLMTEDGWEKNDDGIWEKGGKTASLQISTTAGNQGREQVEELLQSQWEEAGFDLKIKNPQADVLFGNWGPKGVFQVGMYAQVGTPDPGLCIIFCSNNIPTKKNGFVGQNWTRLTSDAIDTPWLASDRELDEAARIGFVRQGQTALADEVASIPLYVKPTVFVWDATKISGPLQDNPVNGPFFNMNLWTLTG
jgi:peptide/nickel transport system substrate-binding protein